MAGGYMVRYVDLHADDVDFRPMHIRSDQSSKLGVCLET